MINLKERLRNKAFIVSLFSAIVLLVQLVLPMFDIHLDYGLIGEIFNALLGVLMVIGVVVDPTTPGLSDSELVLKRK